VDKISKKLAKKYKLSDFKVELIIKSQFGLLKKNIEKGDFESTRLKHLGIFTVKKNRFKYYKNGKRRKKGSSSKNV
jgi:nucleoid DNA-binding protein